MNNIKYAALAASATATAILMATVPAYGQSGGAEANAALMADINVCRAGLNDLAPTLYTYAAGEQPTAMKAGMALFEGDPLSACRRVGEHIEELDDVSVPAAVALAYGSHERVDSWGDYFDGGFGIQSIGSRMVIHCPHNHKIQFDCVSGLERVKLSMSNLHEQLDRIEEMSGKTELTSESFFEAEVVEKEALGDSCKTFLETPSSKTPAPRRKIDFKNKTGEDRIVSWINFDANVNPGKIVKTGTSYTGQSSDGHRFVVMDSDLNCTMTMVISAENAMGELK